ncbi:MAG: bifunctional hydroxymethylpyrimidine kinase/phosphomethylpyrimidine kinase [Halovenus sp.]
MTRNPAPVSPPVVLTIAGSDSGGGAGIQADLKTIEAGGAFGTSAVTSVTAQNTRGVESTHVLPVGEIEAQCRAVLDDFDVAALKTGMLATAAVVELVTDVVGERDVPAVVDPVMVAASGDRLLEPSAEAAYEELIGISTLVTPNADEAEVLTGIEVTDTQRARRAGEELLARGADGALVKGGHVSGADVMDVLVTEDAVETIRHPRIDTGATHGSGCTLSSAIATRLAHGDECGTAVRAGINLLARAVRYNVGVGKGPGAVHHMVAVRDRAERQPTAERVEDIVRAFVEQDASALVPEVGMDVAGATPYAEVPAECAGVEGRITRVTDGVRPNRGVRFDTSSHAARVLLAAREGDADRRFAVDCRSGDDVDRALETLSWPVSECEQAGADGPSVERRVEQAIAEADTAPVALVDRGEPEMVPLVTLLADDAPTLVDRAVALLDALDTANVQENGTT